MKDWKPIADAGGYLAPEKREVWTKIDDGSGVHNVAKLTRRGNLWFMSTADSVGMYVYYTPTHWCPQETVHD